MKLPRTFLQFMVIAVVVLFTLKAFATTYTYDPINRLTYVAYDNGSVIGYTYDAAGNITQISKTVSGGGTDIDPPIISSFYIPSTSTSMTVPVSLTASDNVGVASYCIAESASAASCTAWSTIVPTSYTFSDIGSKTLYVFARDIAGNVSAAASGIVTVTSLDATAPTISSFTLSPTSSSPTVSILSFTATDTVGVTGYCVTETNNAASCNWGPTTPSSFTFTGIQTGIASNKTLYAFAKDASGNISSSASSGVIITLPSNTPFTIQLPKTSQTTCYDLAGTLVSCSGTGQDAEYLKGIAWPSPRFTDNGNQTMTDKLTGLIWSKDANPAAGTKTWQQALDYIKQLNAGSYQGYNDWRLPNRIEMESLLNQTQAIPSDWLTSQGFLNVRPDFYFSSSTIASYLNYAWIVSLGNGDVNYLSKESVLYLWPVRTGTTGAVSLAKSGQTVCYDTLGGVISCSGTGQDGDLQKGVSWPTPRFSDNGDQTVTDTLTGLVWTKNGSSPGPLACGPGASKSWQEALDYVKCLNQNIWQGKTDWRLPNRNELASLVNLGESSSAPWLNTNGFSSVNTYYYWSSTTYAGNTASAWLVNMFRGNFMRTSKSSVYNVWAVRTGQPGSQVLAVTKTGTGSGVVSSNNGTLNWAGNIGTANYNSESYVILSATPSPGSIFGTWSGCDSVSTNTCTVTMSAAKSVTASFIAENQSILISSPTISSTGGSISVGFQASDPENLPMGYEVWLFNGSTPISGTKKINSTPMQSGSSSSLSYTPAELLGLLTPGVSYRARIWMFDNADLKTEVYTNSVTYLAPQAVTFTPSTTKSYGDAPISLAASGGGSGVPVTFSIVSGPGSLSGANNATLTIDGAGVIVVKASQAGNTSYSAAADVTRLITVSPKALTITSNNVGRAYGVDNPVVPGFSSSGLVGTDSIGSVTYAYADTATATAVIGSTHSIIIGTAVFSNGLVSNYSIIYESGTLTVMPNYSLTVVVAGSGNGTVTSNPGSIICSSGSCSEDFLYGSDVNLYATPDSISTFGGWSSGCNGTGACNVALNAAKSVTATFTMAPKAMIGITGYSSLNLAYSGSTTGATIMVLSTELLENLIMSNNKEVTLKGGYNSDFLGTSGVPTVLNGVLKIGSGKLIVQGLVVR